MLGGRQWNPFWHFVTCRDDGAIRSPLVVLVALLSDRMA
jgi:hypothetical protein